jgi:hypothetical protein
VGGSASYTYVFLTRSFWKVKGLEPLYRRAVYLARTKVRGSSVLKENCCIRIRVGLRDHYSFLWRRKLIE